MRWKSLNPYDMDPSAALSSMRRIRSFLCSSGSPGLCELINRVRCPLLVPESIWVIYHWQLLSDPGDSRGEVSNTRPTSDDVHDPGWVNNTVPSTCA